MIAAEPVNALIGLEVCSYAAKMPFVLRFA
jgi:hypothetical protein